MSVSADSSHTCTLLEHLTSLGGSPLSRLPRPSRGLRSQGIVGPRVLGVTTLQILPYIEVRGAPESREVARHLYRPSSRREQVQCHRYLSSTDPRCLGLTEHLL